MIKRPGRFKDRYLDLPVWRGFHTGDAGRCTHIRHTQTAQESQYRRHPHPRLSTSKTDQVNVKTQRQSQWVQWAFGVAPRCGVKNAASASATRCRGRVTRQLCAYKIKPWSVGYSSPVPHQTQPVAETDDSGQKRRIRVGLYFCPSRLLLLHLLLLPIRRLLRLELIRGSDYCPPLTLLPRTPFPCTHRMRTLRVCGTLRPRRAIRTSWRKWTSWRRFQTCRRGQSGLPSVSKRGKGDM